MLQKRPLKKYDYSILKWRPGLGSAEHFELHVVGISLDWFLHRFGQEQYIVY